MSQTPQKQQSGQKMCKSPKNSNFQKHDKIDYENLSTNCTVVGSNNLNLVKKPQIIANVSPAYSNPSPGGGGGSGGYPQSPYSSPASLKSPSPSLKPPTPQPNFPVMQILPNHPLLARPIQTSQPQNIIKLKPHLNILPKPAASPQPSPKPSVSPQSVILNQPTATIMPTAQPLLLNQMPMITTQFILRPQTAAKIQTPMHTATATPQGLILQSSGQPLLQLQPPRSQPMVRVLTNGMQLAPSTTTYVTQMGNQQPISAAQIQAQPTIISNQVQQPQLQQHQQQPMAPIAPTTAPKRRPKTKVKKKLDLANIMKLSGIGDEDDIQFESDASQSENEHNSVPNTPQPQNLVQTSTVQTNLMHADAKKIGNIQISAMPQPTINTATPVVQVLNQNFQSGVISNSTSQAATAQAGIPIAPFLAPNFTINNGLMLQRSSGGLKLTVGEDGRLVLQHDPTINNDLQSQLILQSLLNLNGGLVLQPSVDQQTVQQTVQTIQQQSVQTIQQQTVQSQTIQTVQQQTVQPQTVQHLQHALQPQIQQQTVQQTIQHQTVQSQPLTAHLQQPLQIVQPQPQIVHSQGHSIQSQVSLSQIQGQIQSLLQQQQQQQQHQQQNAIQTQPISFNHQQHTQPVLKVQPFQKPQPPVQTVHPIQSIQNDNQQQHQQQQQQQQQQQAAPTSYVVNLTPEQLEQLKRNGQLTVNGQTIFMQRPNNNKDNNEKKHSPKIKPVKKVNKVVKTFPEAVVTAPEAIKPIANADKDVKLQKSPGPTTKHNILPHPICNSDKQQPSAMVSPQQHKDRQKNVTPIVAAPKTTKVLPTLQQNDSNGSHSNHDVDKLLGQLLEESNLSGATTTINVPTKVPPQRITTIQLTPQKQQHLKSIQLQIQTLSARLTPGDTEMQNALKLLFNEQQKILASGKLLSPDKVYYHNNQLTIVNPSVNLPSPVQVKSEMPSPVLSSNNSSNSNANNNNSNNASAVRSTAVETPVSNTATVQPITTTQSHVMKISVPVPPSPSTEHATQTTTAPTILNTHTANHVINQRINVPQPQPQQPSVQQPTVQQQQQLQQQQTQQSIAKKAQLIETQLNLDQNGAVKPDVHTPFKDKKDACIRLIRYHCMDQPVLSQKDLHKADEIFELTARHFIGKYDRMIDKYRYLLMKESMRQVQTSELMMLDRMFLAEEQQSLMRLRQEYEAQMQMDIPMPIPEPAPPPQPSISPSTSQYTSNNSVGSSSNCGSQDTAVDDYDEWACIQRELGCLTEEPKPIVPINQQSQQHNQVTTLQQQQQQQQQPQSVPSITRTTTPPPPPAKRSASTDSRLETLKRFRVDKHTKKCPDSVHINNSVSTSSSVQNVVVSMTSNTQYATRINNLNAVNSFNSCSSTSSSSSITSGLLQQHQQQIQQTSHMQSMTSATYSSQICTFDQIQQQQTHQQQQLLQDNNSYSQEETEPENNSLDEQVQSAIDSILNLQQNTAPLDLDSILS